MKLHKTHIDKPRLVYVNFFTIPLIKDKDEKLNKYRNAFDYLFHLQRYFDITVLDRIGISATFKKEDIQFKYFKTFSNNKFLIPRKIFLELRELKPEIIYVQGLGYPHYIIILKWFLKSPAKIIVHDHANRLPSNWKYFIFKWADKKVSTYFFTSVDLAKIWLKNGLISSNSKVVECTEGSTYFQYNATIKKEKNSFLWVGRLDKRKDPLTILSAFSTFIKNEPKARLTMFFEDTSLLSEVELFVLRNFRNNEVRLKGSCAHSKLEIWYQQSEFFILGSHREGGPFSLIEAMACGCIPIVTRIPAFLSMIDHGECGFLFEAGNSKDLERVLANLQKEDLASIRKRVLIQFKNNLSNEAIAFKIKEAILN